MRRMNTPSVTKTIPLPGKLLSNAMPSSPGASGHGIGGTGKTPYGPSAGSGPGRKLATMPVMSHAISEPVAVSQSRSPIGPAKIAPMGTGNGPITNGTGPTGQPSPRGTAP